MSGAKMAQINLRVSDAVASDLDALAQHEHATRIDVARQILLDGIAIRKRSLALRLYRDGRATQSRAAEIGGISLWEMIEAVDQASLPDDYSMQDAVDDVRRLVADVRPGGA